ncbi:PAS domain-containing sensor histidine kinase [Aliifodinibius salipaludis]|uniref:histidine kinase n=2 Tax=Fodinibius salipaludis TaxID=2032627 RepID=A0A2A2GDA9_9BACT|nr:PAS domain-containing sensor histidine kinase [Aliifodinibius salipaludis]
MGMNIKTKLYTGLGFLAFLLVLLWGSSLVSVNTLAENTVDIIQNNSRTITYMQNMEHAMSKLHKKEVNMLSDTARPASTNVDSLKRILKREMSKQMKNFTETGEPEASRALRGALMQYLEQFDRFRSQEYRDMNSYQTIVNKYAEIQDLISQITYMNLDAIDRKKDRAQETAAQVILYMTIIGAISTLLALALLLKYPNYIVNPIRELIERIQNIANQNYDQRLEFNTGDEYEELAQAFNTMATRLQEYESSNLAKLKNEKQRIEAIINQMNEAIVGLDSEKNILFVNSKAEELLGLDRNKLVGQYAPDVASTNDLMRKLIKGLMDTEKTNQDEEGDLIKIASENRHIYYSKDTLPVLLDDEAQQDGKQIGTIVTLKNVTHFQEMNEAKSNFVAVVSHELKTPIASINMSLRLLEDERVGPLNEEQVELIDSIRNDADRMKRTTAELLDLSKIESGNIQLNSQPARPSDLLDYAFETMVMQVDQKGIDIEIECEEELPAVKTDLQKSVWVLVNLISNAVRYTPDHGKILLKAEEQPRVVRFSVTDNGKGIPEEYIDKIFQKYFQVYGDKNGSGGSGLGLSIAKEFINAQGGEIGVESELGKGSTFYFTLPKNRSLDKIDSYEV